jgi:hypothetical protein
MSTVFDAVVPFPNALLYLFAENEVEIPDIDGLGSYWRTDTVLAQAVQHDAEGDVQLRVTRTAPDEDAAMMVLYQGLLHSDRGMLEVRNVYDECIVGFRTWSRDVRVMIWGDDPRQAERIVVQCPGMAVEAGE